MCMSYLFSVILTEEIYVRKCQIFTPEKNKTGILTPYDYEIIFCEVRSQFTVFLFNMQTASD